MADHVDPTNGDSDSRVYCTDIETFELREIWSANLSRLFTDSEHISFTNWYYEEDGVSLYSYDPEIDVLASHSLGRQVQVDALVTCVTDGSLRYITIIPCLKMA